MKIFICLFFTAFLASQLEAIKYPNAIELGIKLDIESSEIKDLVNQVLEDYNARHGTGLKNLVTLKSIDKALQEFILEPNFVDIKYFELSVVANSNCPHSHRLNCNAKPKATDFVAKLKLEAEFKGSPETGEYQFTYL